MSSVSFDFRKPTQTGKKSFQDVLAKNEQRSNDANRQAHATPPTQTQAQYSQPQKNSNLPWVLVSVLTVGLIAMSTLALYQKDYFDNLYDSLPNRSTVAGVREGGKSVPNVISGDSFSLITEQSIPSGFVVYRDTQDIAMFAQAGFRSSGILFNQQIGETVLRNGIVVEVLESDNKQSQETFAQAISAQIQTVTGKSASIGDLYIETANNSKLAQINVEGLANKKYYTSVTDDNYYIITVYTELEEFSNLEDENDYNQNIVESLHLN